MSTGVKICLLRLFVLWLVPYRLLYLCSFVRALSFPLFTSLKRCLPFCKLFARNFHFKRLYCLIQYFLYLGGYLLTTGQIYGFFAALPTVCSLSHINGKTPALFPGLSPVICLLQPRRVLFASAKYFSNHRTKILYVPQPLGLLNCS